MKTQKHQIGQAGSFQNQLMSNNSSEPRVGEWVTFLHYTDREVGKVISVDADGKGCMIEKYHAKAKTNAGGMGHQNWEFEPTGSIGHYRWRHGKWRIKYTQIEFSKEFEAMAETYYMYQSLTLEQRKEIYQGQPLPQKVVAGITKEVTRYSPVRILFNQCNYYYDWSF